VFTAEQWIDSGLAALLFCSFPIWVGLLGHWMLPSEPLTPRTVAATLLGVCGVAVIEAPHLNRVSSLEARPLLLGGALMMVSAIVSAFSAVTVKKRLATVQATVSVWGQSIVAAVFLLSAATVFERSVPWRWTAAGTASLAYLSVIGTIVFLGSQWLVPRVPIALTGSFPLVNTVLALVWGTLLAGEKLPARVAAGGALIFLGVVLVTFEPRPARQPRLST
jgi:drug/metabolite transporter (DMT)-like permease